jgi:hypothetical protein
MKTDVTAFLRSNDAEFIFGVQIATDSDKMPIEDASVEWPEDMVPFQPVARIVIRARRVIRLIKNRFPLKMHPKKQLMMNIVAYADEHSFNILKRYEFFRKQGPFQ